MRIELEPVARRVDYEDLEPGDIFSITDADLGEQFYVMHLENGRLHAISLHDGSVLLMKGESAVHLYTKTFGK